jgi:hypothetical protein
MSARPISIHEQVMENTKRMTIRSQQIALQLEKIRTDKKVFFIKKILLGLSKLSCGQKLFLWTTFFVKKIK